MLLLGALHRSLFHSLLLSVREEGFAFTEFLIKEIRNNPQTINEERGNQ
jgi:hypothetical protein